MPPEPRSQTKPEDQFRASLEDVSSIAERLLDVCPATKDLIEVVNLAVVNDAQLKILAGLVFGNQKR